MISNKAVKQLGAEELKYAVGPLLYCPADNDRIFDNMLSGKLGHINTLVMCLEDAILPQKVAEATEVLLNTFNKFEKMDAKSKEQLPLLFIRVRNPYHLEEVFSKFGWFKTLTGFVLPKYDMSVSKEYAKIIHRIQSSRLRCEKYYFMPILESDSIMGADRRNQLQMIAESLDDIDSILNILVGSNDMCRHFMIRRSASQTIYDVGVVRDILIDIIATFTPKYVVNGPVWEYFDGYEWEQGLMMETELDKLNGFIGKACIHWKQVELLHSAMKVNKNDWEDAFDLTNWNEARGVKKSRVSGRMNELATNLSWAERIITLGKIYGVNED